MGYPGCDRSRWRCLLDRAYDALSADNEGKKEGPALKKAGPFLFRLGHKLPSDDLRTVRTALGVYTWGWVRDVRILRLRLR